MFGLAVNQVLDSYESVYVEGKASLDDRYRNDARGLDAEGYDKKKARGINTSRSAPGLHLDLRSGKNWGVDTLVFFYNEGRFAGAS